MNEREFLDLLRYYFRKVKPEDVEEILSDYKAHFTEARERGLSDEQIAAELGHPEDIYASYQSEGIVSEKTKMEKFLTMQNTWPTKHSKRCSRHGMKSALTFRTLPVQQHLSLPKRFLPFVRFCPYSFSRPRCLPLSIIYAFYSHYGCGSLTGTPPADHVRSGGNRMFCQSFHLLHGDVGQKVS